MGVMDYAVENGVRHGETANHLGRALRLSAVRESDGDLAFVGSSSTLFFCHLGCNALICLGWILWLNRPKSGKDH